MPRPDGSDITNSMVYDQATNSFIINIAHLDFSADNDGAHVTQAVVDSGNHHTGAKIHLEKS